MFLCLRESERDHAALDSSRKPQDLEGHKHSQPSWGPGAGGLWAVNYCPGPVLGIAPAQRCAGC